jgi:hypothetical protein
MVDVETGYCRERNVCFYISHFRCCAGERDVHTSYLAVPVSTQVERKMYLHVPFSCLLSKLIKVIPVVSSSCSVAEERLTVAFE